MARKNITGLALLLGASIPSISATNWLAFLTADKSVPTLDQLNIVSFIPEGDAKKESNSSGEEALKFLKQQNLNDSLVINGVKYRVVRGVPDALKNLKQPISIHSGGYSNSCRPYSFGGFTAIKAGLVPGACITFEFPTDTRRRFNFCQEQDIHCVKTICGEVLSKNPTASIILHGGCKGGANNLRFLAEQNEQGDKEKYLQSIKAVIAESPPLNTQKALEGVTPLKLGWFVHAVMCKVFPNYNPNAKTIMQAQSFPAIPVMIGSLPLDTISKLEDMKLMQEYLNKTCKAKVQMFVSKHAALRHGKIRQAPDYQEAIGKFLGDIK